MKRILLATLLFATPALAQEPSTQPSQQSLIQVLHQQVSALTDQLTVTMARLSDAQQQVVVLQAAAKKSDAAKPSSKPAVQR